MALACQWNGREIAMNDATSRLCFMRTVYPEIRKTLDLYVDTSVNIQVYFA
jgi:hypothetical protein